MNPGFAGAAYGFAEWVLTAAAEADLRCLMVILIASNYQKMP
jgi:hypothetical protein